MTTKRLLAMLLVVVAATAVGVRARRAGLSDAGTRRFDVSGVVMAAPAGGQVTIAHGDIPGYMPAMTMPFSMGPGAPALSVGDRVRFTLKVAEEWSRAEDFEVTGRNESIARADSAGESAGRTRLKKGDRLPEFSLVAHDGSAFTEADLQGRLTAITFIFTRCPVPEFCPLMVKRFRQVQTEIERNPMMRDVRLVSVTLDPAFDTPQVLAAYASAMDVHQDRWRFVTGEPDAVARLTSAFSLHVERNGAFIDHTLATAIVDGDGRIVEIWRGNGWKTDELIDGLRRQARHANEPQSKP